MADKNYINWFIKERDTQYWKVLNVSLNLEELNKLPVDEKYGTIKLVIAPRKEVGKFWQTHSCYEDTFVPKPKEQSDENPF